MRWRCYNKKIIIYSVERKEEIVCRFSFQLKPSKKGKPIVDLLKLIRGLDIDPILNDCCGTGRMFIFKDELIPENGMSI
jgi:hypothetical protein